jgi:hypothetical protein
LANKNFPQPRQEGLASIERILSEIDFVTANSGGGSIPFLVPQHHLHRGFDV